MIVYLHGFASTGSSPKVNALRERFGSDKVMSPDLPFNPFEVHKLINSLVQDFLSKRKEGEKLVFVGTSLGAFYSNFFGHLYDCPVVLVNPSVYPNETLASRLGSNRNYVTGEEFFVSLAHLEDLDQMRKYLEANYTGSLVNLFLAKDDDVIPYDVALEAYKYPAFVKVTEDGGHRFNDYWDLVVDRVEEILTG
jgi:predicted esterase YcpF (UPF0227 family)